jgi:hypothetical protein
MFHVPRNIFLECWLQEISGVVFMLVVYLNATNVLMSITKTISGSHSNSGPIDTCRECWCCLAFWFLHVYGI